MKLTNEKIMDFMSIDLTAKKLPIKLGYAYAINRTTCESFHKEYEAKRDEIIRCYAKKDDDGNILPPTEDGLISIDNFEAFASELAELNTMEVEVPLTMTSVESLEKCDNEMFDSLSVAEISSISFMIED